ncbi:7-keto-8-aminopelargonate synthetase [Paenibacillus popilliae ATCC 14706]|uniref:7-keto-8-aminopelargonate synthetase n=1 Tax=Paenibacillus popilliae ATCC 14706 TaxID=1212764 RepID=M9LYM9_PAEPP|nr:7-keto-8-aminopelargonate synthetase [Paenibacillus popilliae ATCC 14706]
MFRERPQRMINVAYGVDSFDPMPTKEAYQTMLHFGSYNYSGLNGHPKIIEVAMDAL